MISNVFPFGHSKVGSMANSVCSELTALDCTAATSGSFSSKGGMIVQMSILSMIRFGEVVQILA